MLRDDVSVDKLCREADRKCKTYPAGINDLEAVYGLMIYEIAEFYVFSRELI
jgi:hypothetical protein